MNYLQVLKHIDKAQTAWNWARTAYTSYQDRKLWSLRIEEGDELYPEVAKWVDAQVRDLRRVQVRTWVKWSDDKPQCHLTFLPNVKRAQEINLAGHSVWVGSDEAKSKNESSNSEIVASMRQLEPRALVFTTMSEQAFAGLKVKFQELLEQAEKAKAGEPSIYLPEKWNSAWKRSPLRPRRLESVVLQAGLLERLSGDLGQFLASEDLYAQAGAPYHRGYLLWGKPGTGKTSAIRALAAAHGLSLYYFSPGDQKSDMDLTRVIASIPPRSILLLEDIDTFDVVNREAEGGLSLGALLNSLDGVTTPHGLIVFMTTNDRGALDPALLRPGRVDLDVEVGYPDAEQVERLFRNFFAQELGVEPGLGECTAHYYEVFKRHMGDPDSARAEVSARRLAVA